MSIAKEITVNKPSIASVQAFRKFSLNINIKRFTTDSNGTILADADIDISQKKPFPYHLFSQFDQQGGYAIADNILRQEYNTNLFGVYIWGNNTPLFFFNPLATINGELKKGDTVFIYVDDPIAPSFFTFVIITTVSPNAGYTSLVAQTSITQLDTNHWGVCKIWDLRYTWYNDQQLNHPVYLIHNKFNSAFKYDPINPAAYYFPQQHPNVKVAVIPLDVILNQYFGMSGFLAYENPLLNMSFELYI